MSVHIRENSTLIATSTVSGSDGRTGASPVVDAFFEEGRLAMGELASTFLEWVYGVGEAIPILAPVVVALKIAGNAVQGANRNKDQLEELMDRCILIIALVVENTKRSKASVNVKPLEQYLNEVTNLAKRYHSRGVFSRMARFRSDGRRIQDMQNKIQALVEIIGLGMSVDVSAQVQEMRGYVESFFSGQKTQLECVLQGLESNRTATAYIQGCLEDIRDDTKALLLDTKALLRRHGIGPPSATAAASKLAPVPKGAPITAHWHVTRNSIADTVSANLCNRDGPWMVGIVGCSGSGKTTAAAAIVGDKSTGTILRCGNESHVEACERLDRVRRHFVDGVIWLRVGRGAGSEDKLTSLMLQLARMVEDVGITANDGPRETPTYLEGGTATTAYIRDKVTKGNSGDEYRCLLIADDVWESAVMEQLKDTGMRVLVTTRDVKLVRGAGGIPVEADMLTRDEAKAAVRGAAELRPDAVLPTYAYDVIERCDSRAMYVGSVAKWEYVKNRDDEDAWKKALDSIDKHAAELAAERATDEAGDIIADRHHAILRAGFDCLACEEMHSMLYLALAVMPDSHSFAVYEAAILLFGHQYTERDLEKADDIVAKLERWAIVRVDGTGLYQMHDARRKFARKTLMERGNVRVTAVARWREHLSTLDALRSVDLLVLLGLWQALERVGGDGWRKSRPYDMAVEEMDPADQMYFTSIKMLANLYQVEGDLDGVEELMMKILKRNENLKNQNPLVIANAYHWRVLTTSSRGQLQEAKCLRAKMSEFVDPAVAYWKSCSPTGGIEDSLALHTLGSLCLTAGRIKEAEKWFQSARDRHEAAGLRECQAHVGAMLQGLAHCLQHDNRCDEAEVLFRRAINIIKMRRGPNSLEEASTLCFLAVCELDAKRPRAAEVRFRRALDIYKRKTGPPSRQVPNLLHSLAVCLRAMGQRPEAQKLLQESLAIQEKIKVGSEGEFHIACTLHSMALCERDAGRLEEAVNLFSRALAILQEKMSLKDDDPQVMATTTERDLCLEKCGVCREAGSEATVHSHNKL